MIRNDRLNYIYNCLNVGLKSGMLTRPSWHKAKAEAEKFGLQ